MNAYEITLLCVIGAIVAVWLVDRFTGGHITEKIIQWHPVLAALTALTSAVFGGSALQLFCYAERHSESRMRRNSNGGAAMEDGQAAEGRAQRLCEATDW